MARIVTLILLLSTLSFNVLSADEKAISSDEQVLAQTLPANEVLWLESSNGNFLSLHRTHLAKMRRGIAILVPETTTNIINPDYIEPLRHHLNDVGWATLAIMPPLFIIADDKPSAYADALIERVNAALAWSRKEHQHVVLIMQGRQMAYLIEAQVQQHLQPVNAVVLLNALPAFEQDTDALSKQYPDSATEFSTQLTALMLPLLDLNHLDRSQTIEELTERKALATKQQANYRQIKFYTRDNYLTATKSIYGWLSSIGLK